MSKYLAGIAAVSLIGLAAMPVTATAAERQTGASTNSTVQSDELSSRHRGYRHRRQVYRHYYGPRRYYGPRYGYYGSPYRSYYGHPYGYGYHRPGVALGLGPFGFRVF